MWMQLNRDHVINVWSKSINWYLPNVRKWGSDLISYFNTVDKCNQYKLLMTKFEPGAIMYS